MADIVVNLRDGRAVWLLPDWAVAELEAALPDGWTLYVEATPTDGTGDGSGPPPPGVMREVADARVYVGFGVPEPVLEAGAASLQWVHSAAAGVGGSLHDAMRRSSVQFTNSAGIHGPPIAETVLGMLLHFARGLDFAVAAQAKGEWDDGPFLVAASPVRELSSMRIGILGYGGIGREIGRRLRALGSEVLGLKRSPREGERGKGDAGGERAGGERGEGDRNEGDRNAGGLGENDRDALGVILLHGETGLARLLRESEALVIAAPDTPATRGILSAERIRSLPRGAVVVNVARGRLVDEVALVEALQDGHLRGAGLDVFSVEPLPADHPLWTLPNVLITPHTSPVTRGFWRREMDLILGNLRCLLDGRALRNEVDRDRGY